VNEDLHGLVEKQIALLDTGLIESGKVLLVEKYQGEVSPEHSERSGYWRTFPLFALGAGVKRSAVAITKLCSGDDPDVDSGQIIARALVERTINLAYLAFCPEEEFQRWIEYSQQKEFRLLNRHQKAGNMEFHLGIELPPDIAPDLERLVENFTGRSGRENTRWSKLTMNERLGAVETFFDGAPTLVARLLQALTAVYAEGAEGQHGTPLGVGLRFIRGYGTDDKHSAHGVVLLAVVMCLDSAIQVWGKFTDREEWASEGADLLRGYVTGIKRPEGAKGWAFKITRRNSKGEQEHFGR